MSTKTTIARRGFIAAGVVASAAAAFGGGYLAGIFKRTPAGPFGDLLSNLDDLDDAKIVGAAYLAHMPTFDEGQTASQLRARLDRLALPDALDIDISGNQLAEAGGWVLPETLALLCALAAKSG